MPKIALIYDHLATSYGGAENVLLALHEAYPNSPLYTSVYDAEKAKWAHHLDIRTTFLQTIPFASTHHRLATFGMPIAFETLNLDEFDIIISVASTCAKGVLTKPHQLHITYLLTPTRFIFSHREEYLSSSTVLGIRPIRYLVNQLLAYLSWWDRIAAHRPDVIITISKHISKRCEEYYHRSPSTVIYPPVSSIEKISNDTLKAYDYFLCLSRLVNYKRVDLCIESMLLVKKPLIIVGDGPDKKQLSQLHPHAYIRKSDESIEAFIKDCFRITTNPVCFVGAINETEKAELLTNAKALLMPGEEDFGITALEAAAVGIPTVLHEKSGASEILNDTCAVYIKNETIDEMLMAFKQLDQRKWFAKTMQERITNYTTKSFIKIFKKQIEKEWHTFQESRLA